MVLDTAVRLGRACWECEDCCLVVVVVVDSCRRAWGCSFGFGTVVAAAVGSWEWTRTLCDAFACDVLIWEKKEHVQA